MARNLRSGLRQSLKPSVAGGLGDNDIFTTASLDLNFAKYKNLGTIGNVATGQNLVTFTRASSGTYVGSDGLIKTATTNEARFDHDPTTGESLGLLVEEQRQNLLTYSQDFTNFIWPTSSTATITTNTGVDDPQGTNTAATITNISGPNLHRLISGTAGAPYTYSVWLRRRSGSGLIYLTVGDAINQVVTVGDTWTRVSATNTPTSTVVRAYVVIGSTGDSVDIWGAQLEEGSFPTSYIPTEGSAVTRAADVASITGTNFSSWYRQDEGTVLVETQLYSTSARNAAGFDINDNSANNRAIFRAFTTGSADQFTVRSGGSTVAQISSIGSPSVAIRKSAATISLNSYAISADGASPVEDTSGALPISVSQLFVGSALFGAESMGGYIRRLTYWPSRLPNDTLQSITT